MSVGYGRSGRGWAWRCDDHPRAGRRFRWANPERRARASLLRHIIRKHPASEWVTPTEPS